VPATFYEIGRLWPFFYFELRIEKMLNHEQLLKLIRDKLDHPATPRELLQRLKLPRQERPTFKKLLADLVESGALVQSIAAHEGPVASLTFPDEAVLASSGADGSVRAWDARTARLIAALAERRGWTAALTPLDGRRLLVAWSDGQVDTLAVPRIT